MKIIKRITNKRITAVAIIIFMLAANIGIFNFTVFAADTSVEIVKIEIPETIQSGNIFEAKLTIKNNTNSAQNIIVSTSNTSGSVIKVTTSDKIETSVAASSESTVSFYFNVSANESHNIYEINFKVKYNIGYENKDILDEDGKVIGTDKIEKSDEISETRRITVTQAPTVVEPVAKDPLFEKLSEVHAQSANIGGNTKIAFRFVNLGGAATNTRVSIKYPDGVTPVTETEIYVGLMTPNESFNCVFDFDITNKAKAGMNNFVITVTADAPANTLSFPFGIMFNKTGTDEEISKTVPNIKIVSTELPENIKKGEKFVIKAVLENTGTDAENVEVKIKTPEGMANVSSNIVLINSLKENAKTEVSFEIIATNNAVEHYNLFEMLVEYNITDGDDVEKVTKSQNMGLYVLADEDDEKNADFSINAKLPAEVKQGEDFKLSVTVKNNGETEKNLSLKIDMPAGIENKTINEFLIPELKSGESITKEFVFNASESVAGKYCRFDILLTGNNIGEFKQLAGTTVSAPKEPKIIIDNIKIPQNLNIGDTFNVDVTVANTGAADAENVTLTIGLPAGIQNKTAKTVKIDSLKSGNKTTKTFTFYVTPGVSYGYNSFNLEVSYPSESEAGGNRADQFFGAVVNSSDLRIESIKIPGSVGINTDFNVEVAIKNTGADTTDVMLSISPSGGLTNKTANTVKIDSIKSGATMVKTFTFMATENSPNGYVSIDVSLTDGEEIIQQYSGTIVRNPPKTEDPTEPDEKTDIPVVIISKFSYTNTSTDNSGDNNIPTDYNQGYDNNFNGGYDDGFNIYYDDSDGNGMIDTMPIEPREYKDDIFIESETGKFIDTFVVAEPVSPNMAMPAPEVIMPSPIYPDTEYPDYGDNNNFPNDSGSENINSESKTNAVYGGETFIFTVELLNTHKSVAIKDLKVTISQEHGIFNPKSGSNTFFVERLEPGETTEIQIELLVKSDADPDSYGLTVSMSYKSEKGESTSSSEIINIPVQQKMRFSIGDLPPINAVEMGDDAYITLQFGNLGKSWIYNVIVRVQGDGFMNMNGTYYAGNIEKGKFISNEFTLTPYMAGYLSGSFLFTYEDADGNPHYDECPFSFMVMGGEEEFIDMPPIDGEIEYGPDGQPVIKPTDETDGEETGGFWLFTNMNLLKWAITIGGGLLIIAIIVIIIVVIVKVRKKKSDDDDDDMI